MANLATNIASVITKVGQSCSVVFPAIGLGSTAQPGSTIQTFVKIGKKSVFNQSGQLVSVTTGLLPDLGRSLEKATIKVGQRTYTVVGSVETTYLGATLLQKVTLA